MSTLRKEKSPVVRKCYYPAVITDMISPSYTWAFFNEASIDNVVKLVQNFKREPFSEMALLIFGLGMTCTVNDEMNKKIVDACGKTIFKLITRYSVRPGIYQ
uniref:DUF659 domain-containing protein n=1 Tax=Rhabditophanes sp. KR3021 TaxID=114890 RepID=A0AC35TJ34_9BILA